eukprot:EG_transcript_32183
MKTCTCLGVDWFGLLEAWCRNGGWAAGWGGSTCFASLPLQRRGRGSGFMCLLRVVLILARTEPSVLPSQMGSPRACVFPLSVLGPHQAMEEVQEGDAHFSVHKILKMHPVKHGGVLQLDDVAGQGVGVEDVEAPAAQAGQQGV